MLAYSVSVQLHGGKGKTYNIKASSNDDAIAKAVAKARKAALDATGLITVTRAGSFVGPQKYHVTI